MKTPLAGLKTQAQLALMLDSAAVRQNALPKIVVGVDRTAGLVKQLRDLAAREVAEALNRDDRADAGHLLRMVANALVRIGDGIDGALDGLVLDMQPDLFTLAARNLVENAIRYSGRVACRAAIVVEDDGPGTVSEDLRRQRCQSRSDRAE